MELSSPQPMHPRHVHAWLRKLRVAYAPDEVSPFMEEFVSELLDSFAHEGHTVLQRPEGVTDVLLTTATFGQPVNWHEAVLFTARRRFGLANKPVVFTLVQVTLREFERLLAHFNRALEKEKPDPQDYAFPGLAPRAYHTLHEQGRRGGALMAVVRLLQSQTLSARVVLVVGEEHPRSAYTFDLVGAHPRTDGSDLPDFYRDLVLRIATAASTHEITDHEVIGAPIPAAVWKKLGTPEAMCRASRELGEREFFTEMVSVANLVSVPLLDSAVSSQYSEGCFATWEPALGGLIATITGSARPVEKDRLSDDELAVIVGVRSHGDGVQVRHVEGKRNDPPSSEAVEMMQIDLGLPHPRLGAEWGFAQEAPVVRSKLHGHRGVRAYDPQRVEHLPLGAAYYDYPVSCSTEAQASAICAAFARSQALKDPQDARQVVFTVLPGHGVVIAEKWVPGKVPFQVIWEAMDSGILQIDNHVPQGPLEYLPTGNGRVKLHEY